MREFLSFLMYGGDVLIILIIIGIHHYVENRKTTKK
jgi:hypothetical protein